MTKTQLRGHCPCCGREQAVLASGRMSKHGYTVEHHWFHGVCNGERHPPMELDNTVAPAIVADVRAEVTNLLKLADDLSAGRVAPVTVLRGSFRKPEAIPFAAAAAWEQRQAVRDAISTAKHRAAVGIAFADQLQSIQEQVFGQPLREVEKAPPPARPTVGERRKLDNGVVVVATRVEGQRVYWSREDNARRGWTGLQSWRAMAHANP